MSATGSLPTSLLVTGGSRGIGAVIVEQAAVAGSSVCFTYPAGLLGCGALNKPPLGKDRPRQRAAPDFHVGLSRHPHPSRATV